MSEAVHLLRYIEKDSPVHRMDPISKVAWLLIVAVSMFTFKAPLSGGSMLLGVLLLTLVLARIPLRVVVRNAVMIFGLATLLGFFHAYVTPGRALLQLGPLTISDAGLWRGWGFFCRLAVVVLSSFLLIWTTDIHDLMVGLVKVGLPYRFAFAVFMALRFLPLIQREVDAVRAAHAIRGRAARFSIQHRLKLWQRYIFTVLINGLRKAEVTAVAIECRAFGAYPQRTFVKDVQWTWSGWLMALLTVAWVVALHLGVE